MEIVTVRHAQPDWEPDGRAVDEPGLTALGREQAACVAESLRGESFDVVYASPLRRVRETAEPIAKALDRPVITHSWLREIGLPSLAGHTSEQVQHFFAEAHARQLEHWWDGTPGGESFRHFHERVTGGLEGLLAGQHRIGVHEDAGQRLFRVPEGIERILVIAHEGTIAVLLSHLLGIEPVPWAFLRFSTAWAGISRLRTVATGSGDVFALESFNRVAHLAPLDAGPATGGRPSSD